MDLFQKTVIPSSLLVSQLTTPVPQFENNLNSTISTKHERNRETENRLKNSHVHISKEGISQ